MQYKCNILLRIATISGTQRNYCQNFTVKQLFVRLLTVFIWGWAVKLSREGAAWVSVFVATMGTKKGICAQATWRSEAQELILVF